MKDLNKMNCYPLGEGIAELMLAIRHVRNAKENIAPMLADLRMVNPIDSIVNAITDYANFIEWVDDNEADL